jgi:glucokinase
MKALVIDLGRSKIRYGVAENNRLTQLTTLDTPGPGVFELVRSLAKKVGILKEGGGSTFPIGAALAIAAPGPYNAGQFTGLEWPGWEFSADDLAAHFTENLVVVHDVMAGAAALDSVQAFENLRRAAPTGQSPVIARSTGNPKAFIQTGVGLGAAASLVTLSGRRFPISGEGGSSTIGAFSKHEIEVMSHFLALSRKKDSPLKWGFPTAQALLSAENLRHYSAPLGGDFAALKSEEIIDLARSRDKAAKDALNVYAGFLGSFAGNVALMFRAYEGIAIAGWIPKQLKQDEWDIFFERFQRRGSATFELEDIPVWYVDDDFHTLVGLASLISARIQGR